ncbi:N-acetylmuramic acid 6-phosphate etherase [Planifilum fulgidum]|jgi:N-acetylmuramic acid 6-phosphate etherase|uniref:N-acetylmuramic acid 6-phosphate etherase n=1 Tax=Planifilum fulgidum TaxID=201973 RepID=A0A1I2PLK3_9BACL|nr:N-acetylmuramic acid 6-phosphate etherase [Planifilum fulgidum]SFG17095.1 N-acetylmuramic acid 6-phosphate etherase [Planifilum fulgidum]
MEQLEHLTTERENEKSVGLDEMSPLEIVTLMNEEDRTVAEAVRQVLPAIAEAVEAIAASFRAGGRLIYVGAGTSGRLGVLDASELPPTFGLDPSRAIALMAGGREAVFQAKEGAEDDAEAGRRDLQGIRLEARDAVVGISASGRTPYVVGALRYAKEIGAKAISLSCNRGSRMSSVADVAIEVVTGPEVLTGSTRLKAGTAQKMVLNMLSTAAMVRLGKTYKNLMVDVKPTNEKLMDRARRILMKATGVSYEEAERALKAADHQVKVALVMIRTGATAEEARARLEAAGGFVRGAVEG